MHIVNVDGSKSQKNEILTTLISPECQC